jgi:hypothetical protein
MRGKISLTLRVQPALLLRSHQTDVMKKEINFIYCSYIIHILENYLVNLLKNLFRCPKGGLLFRFVTLLLPF